MSLRKVSQLEEQLEEANYLTEPLVRSYLVDNQWTDRTLQREEQQQQQQQWGEDMLQEGPSLWGLLRNLHVTPRDNLLLPASPSPPLLLSDQEAEEQVCGGPVSWESSSNRPSTWTRRGNTSWWGEASAGGVGAAARWEPPAALVGEPVALTSTLAPFSPCSCPSPSRSTTASPLAAWATAPTLTRCSS
ncbi:uncharacterized [Lates japonicus]